MRTSPSSPTTPRHRVLAVLLAALVLIGGAHLAAYAADGQRLLLGKTGVATKKTTLKNVGSGPALHLKSEPGQPPLKVSSTHKINRLNADLIDGLSAAALQNQVWVYELSTPPGRTGLTTFALPGLPPGRYLAHFNVASLHSEVPDYFACWVWTGKLTGVTYSDYQGLIGGQSGFAYVDATDEPPTFECQVSDGSYRVLSHERPSEITLIAVDTVTVAQSVGGRSSSSVEGRLAPTP